jgi:prophage tail gpP-like protein
MVGGHMFDRWTAGEVDKDLRNISGGFMMEYLDTGRVAQAVSPDIDIMKPFQIIKPDMPYSVLLDGELVQKGWIDQIKLKDDADELHAQVSGRDVCGDLIDCAAAPNGPVEWRGLTVLQIAQKICAPFGLTVRADVDVGAPFPVFGIQLDEQAMSAIERGARQRGLLMVSDGVGGLVLTVGGNTRAPDRLARGVNIFGSEYTSNWCQRYSDYYVKGQTNQSNQRAGATAAMTPDTVPTSTDEAIADAQDTAEASTIVVTGHAIDPEVTRYRPIVRSVKTQSGSASAQAQAEWALRVSRGMSETLNYTVKGWRAGPQLKLWVTNQVAAVNDQYLDLNKDMLISGVRYRFSNKGVTTLLRIAGRTAFDRINESESSAGHVLTRKPPRSFGPTRNG